MLGTDGVLYRDYDSGPARVLIQDPCPLGLLEILIVAHMPYSSPKGDTPLSNTHLTLSLNEGDQTDEQQKRMGSPSYDNKTPTEVRCSKGVPSTPLCGYLSTPKLRWECHDFRAQSLSRVQFLRHDVRMSESSMGTVFGT